MRWRRIRLGLLGAVATCAVVALALDDQWLAAGVTVACLLLPLIVGSLGTRRRSSARE